MMPISLHHRSKTPGLFSIEHLLLAGLVIDRGQLTRRQKAALDKRAEKGKLIKSVTSEGGLPCWRVAGLSTEKVV